MESRIYIYNYQKYATRPPIPANSINRRSLPETFSESAHVYVHVAHFLKLFDIHLGSYDA